MVIRLLSLSTLVTILACGAPAPELTPLQRAGVQAALEGWRAAGLPEPDGARCDFSHVYVRWSPDSRDFVSRCGSKAAAACLQWSSSNHFFRPTEYPVIVLRPGFVLEANSEPVIHECMHALYHCSGMAWWTTANTGHLDPRVWSAAGGDTAAQSRARLLFLPVVQ